MITNKDGLLGNKERKQNLWRSSFADLIDNGNIECLEAIVSKRGGTLGAGNTDHITSVDKRGQINFVFLSIVIPYRINILNKAIQKTFEICTRDGGIALAANILNSLLNNARNRVVVLSTILFAKRVKFCIVSFLLFLQIRFSLNQIFLL